MMQAYPTYGPVGVPPQKGPYTPNGVKWCMTAFVIYLAALSIQIVYGCWIALSMDSINSGSESILFSAMTTAYAGLSAVLNMIVVAFFLVGFGHLYAGKNEFGPQRARRVDTALYMIVAAIVTAMIGYFVTFALQISTYSFLYPYSRPDPAVFYAIAAVNAIAGTLVGAFVAAAIALPIHGLIDDGRDRQLYLAAALGTATSGVVAAVAFLQMPSIIDALVSGNGTLNWSSGLPSIVAGFMGLLTFMLFLMLYRNVSDRIRSGALRPTRPPPQPLVWIPLQMVPMVPVYPAYQQVVPVQPVMPPQVPPPEPPKQ